MVNQQFSFAVHIMMSLAFAGETMDSRALARSVNTNPVVVRRLLLALGRAGLTETRAGKNGGTILRKHPAQIRLLAIYDAIEPKPLIAINERKAARDCAISCNMKKIMARIAESTEQTMRRHLRAITLAQLLHKVR